MSQQFDAIIIGAGQSGVPLAKALVRSGYKTALIERDQVGGTCLNWGCTPTKTMIASASAAYRARRAADFGVQVGPVTVDMQQVRQRKRDLVKSFVSGAERRLIESGVELVRGEASFAEPEANGLHRLAVRLADGQVTYCSAELVFIDTGSRPAQPSISGLDRMQYYDSTSIMELDHQPEHLLVLGGGYVGLEFAQMFCRFGSRVTVVHRGQQVLVREDPDAAEAIAEVLRQDGIEILLNSEAQAVKESPEGQIMLTVRGPEGERVLQGSHLLAAAGRIPNSDRLNLPAVGVTVDQKGYIQVNERLETNVQGIYALGDVKGGPAFTHISYDDYRIICTNLLHDPEIDSQHGSITGRMVPYVVFIDPQYARVGMSETEARVQNQKIKIAKIPMNYISRAIELDEQRGFMKAVVEADSGQILGFSVLGVEGGDIMAMVQLAMMGRLPYTTLRDAIFAHPTLSEGLNTLFNELTDG